MLRYFHELMQLKVILDQGSMNRAAAQIGVTQPALTRSIGRLEASLGVKLLNRTPRGVFSTAYCDAIIDHINIICGELDRAEAELESVRHGTSGQLTCGGTLSTINRLFVPSINFLRSQRPTIKIRVVETLPSALLAMLRSGELDVAVCAKADDFNEPELTSEILAHDDVGLFVSDTSDIAVDQQMTLQELNERAQWVLPSWSGSLYRRILQRFEIEKIVIPPNTIETNSISLLKGFLRTNPNAVAITATGTLFEDLRRGAIRQLRGNWKFVPSRTIVYWRSNTILTPSALFFVQCIRATAKRLTDDAGHQYV